VSGRQTPPAGPHPHHNANPNRRLDPEARVWALIDAEARRAALLRVEMALLALTRGGRLDVAARDLESAVQILTTDVDRRIATANKVLLGTSSNMPRLRVVA